MFRINAMNITRIVSEPDYRPVRFSGQVHYKSSSKEDTMRYLNPLLILILSCGCYGATSHPSTAPTTSPAARLIVPNGEARIIQSQRTTKDLPGSNGRVRLTIDDITSGQVKISISMTDGQLVRDIIIASQGDLVDFSLDGKKFTLTVSELRNNLIGEDVAVFMLTEQSAHSNLHLSEEQKILALIESIRSLKGAVFVRNDKEYSSDEAANHIKDKWQWKKNDIRTAEDFIRIAASTSSFSGDPYIIRFADKTQMKSGEYLSKELAKLEDIP